MSKFIALDIETDGLNFQTDKIICVGFSDGYYYTKEKYASNFADEVNAHIQQIKAKGLIITMQNGSFDTKFLRMAGIEVENEWDTMVAAYLLTERPGKLALDSLVSYYLGLPSWKQDFKSGDAYADPKLMQMYCITDCKYTAQLAEKLEEKLIDEGKLEFFHKLMRARQMLTRAELNGIKFDTEACKKLLVHLEDEYKQQMEFLNKEGLQYTVNYKHKSKKATFNWGSPTQIKWLLKEQLGLSVVHPLKKEESADIAVLEMNAKNHPIIPRLIEMRATAKLMSTLNGYLESVGPDGRLHANFNATNTITGRLSSSGDLNLQQVDNSKRVRSLFVSDTNMSLIIADMAQVEPRFAAHYSKDPILCKMFKDEEDLYGTIAVQILGANCTPNEVKTLYPDKRKVAKVIGLSVLYGIGVNKLCGTIVNDGGVKGFTIQDARQVIDTYFEKFKGLRDLQMNVHRAIVAKGHIVNFEGRKVNVSEDKVHRDGVNSLLQSSASDFLLFKVVDFESRIAELGGKILALVHDEVIIEIPSVNAELCASEFKEFVSHTNTRVPMILETGIGNNWGCK